MQTQGIVWRSGLAAIVAGLVLAAQPAGAGESEPEPSSEVCTDFLNVYLDGDGPLEGVMDPEEEKRHAISGTTVPKPSGYFDEMPDYNRRVEHTDWLLKLAREVSRTHTNCGGA